MGNRRESTRTSRRRAIGRLRKLRGLLWGKPSPLDALLRE
jgi:hypothetical protein